MQQSSVQPTQDVSTARRDFRLLLSGQSISLVGDQFMVIALPLLAVSVVSATEAQAVLLPFALYLPFLLVGLQAGAMIDYLRRRSVMLLCEAVQVVTFLTIALLGYFDRLSFPVLMLLVGVSGVSLVFFQIAYTSFLPELYTDKEKLHKANSWLTFFESSSKSLGPMLAGPVIALFGTVIAVFVNAVSSIVSLVTIGLIQHKKERIELNRREKQRGWMRRDIAEGLVFVFRHPILEPVITCGVVYVMFTMMVRTTIVLYCVKVMGLSESLVGIVIGASALGFPIGNLLSVHLVRRVGVGRGLVLSATTAVVGLAFIPVAGMAGSVLGLIIANVIHGMGEGSFGPTAVTLRQTAAPAELLGRVNSVQRVLTWGAFSIGSLLASGATLLFGLDHALWIGGLCSMLCVPVLARRGVLLECLRGEAASQTRES
ncbi:MFS transporter [Gynuella sp.]|uniref:MFS transporter n=1 Tax=Gynuella sp. TaxID=2969146 RepID=UPI003D112440